MDNEDYGYQTSVKDKTEKDFDLVRLVVSIQNCQQCLYAVKQIVFLYSQNEKMNKHKNQPVVTIARKVNKEAAKKSKTGFLIKLFPEVS